jgi:hypothetical protein
MFLGDMGQASFAMKPIPNPTSWIGKRIRDVGDTGVGKLFLKNADHVTRLAQDGSQKIKFGIGESGKTLRTSPFLVAGGLGVGYGGYRAKKTYDKYKPEIETGRKLMRKYNQFKNIFNKEGN